MLPQPRLLGNIADVKQPSAAIKDTRQRGLMYATGIRIAVSPNTLAPDLKHHEELALLTQAASVSVTVSLSWPQSV